MRPLLALLSCLLALLAACGPGDGSVTIKTNGMSFVNDEIHVKAGELVTLRVVNTDGYAHAFDLDEFDIHTILPAEATFGVTFTPTEPGRFRFYCGHPGHEAAGMVGVLVVEP